MAKRAKREQKREASEAEETLMKLRRELDWMIEPIKRGLTESTETHVWQVAKVGLQLRIMLCPEKADTIYDLAAYAIVQEAKRQLEAEHGVQEVVE